VKFGHRLEIIAAIENSELTLMNPVIVSIRSDAFFKSAENWHESQTKWGKKWENTSSNEREVQKWFSNVPRKTLMSFKIVENCSTSVSSNYPKADITCDSNRQKVPMFEGADIWRPKDDMILRSGMSSEDNRVVQKIISKAKPSPLAPIELPPVMPKLDGQKKLEDMTMEFVRGGEERLSTIFSNAKCDTTAPCGCKAQNKCWGSLAVVGGSE